MTRTDIKGESSVPEDLPCIFVLIPYEQRMKTKAGFDAVVDAAVSKAEKELLQSHRGEKAKTVINKLHHLLQSINYETHSKSMSIMVSPLTEKVFYFDYEPVEWSHYRIA